jgi:AmiR/NasT family two-component response regulator
MKREKRYKYKLKTIIADDDAFIVRTLREYLEEAGYEVEDTASNGIELINKCRTLKPDLVFVDIMMPQMDGIEAAKVITGERLAKCVIVLTSFDDSESAAKAAEAGASGYMTKPVNRDILVPTIESAMKSSSQFFELNKKIANADKRLETFEVIEKAKLMIMERYAVDEETAYENIRETSRKSNISMAEVAEIIISRNR